MTHSCATVWWFRITGLAVQSCGVDDKEEATEALKADIYVYNSNLESQKINLGCLFSLIKVTFFFHFILEKLVVFNKDFLILMTITI